MESLVKDSQALPKKNYIMKDINKLSPVTLCFIHKT